MKVFRGICLKHSVFFIVGLGLAYVLSLIMVKGNAIIGDTIDDMLMGNSIQLFELMVPFLVMVVLGFAVAYGRSIAVTRYAMKAQADYRDAVGRKLYTLEYKYFDKNSSASVINKMNADIAAVEGFLTQNLPDICANIVAMITYAVYIGSINIGLLVLMLVCYPVLFYFTNKIVKKIEALRKTFRQKSDVITEISQDCISGILVLRSFGVEEHFQEKLDAAADDLVENEGKRTRISNSAIITRRMLQWLPNIICAVYAYTLVLHGNISLGELVVFLLLLQKFVDAYIGVPFDLVDAKDSLVSVKRIEEILSQEDETSGAYREGADNKEIIAFSDVSFSYVEDKTVLSGLSFTIENNSSVAFVGDSGGGKSTIFHILCGFYRVSGGSYRLMGREFAEWDIASAREQFALVSQNVFLFPTTIYENVRYGNPDATREEIIEACKKARIHDFIVGLPEGYESIVGERGILLSGGERQRISMARAFLKNAPILLLDEPTSAVDVQTERLIQEAIGELTRGRTCITIAHRLSTVKDADKIMVVKEGRIAEQGSHAELLAMGGIYTKMYGKEENHEELEDI